MCGRLENTACVQHREPLAFSTHKDSSWLSEDSPGTWRATSVEKHSDFRSFYLPSISLTRPGGISGFNSFSFPSPWLHTVFDCLQSSSIRTPICLYPTRVPPKEKEYTSEATILQSTHSLTITLPPSPLATRFSHPHTYSPSPELSLSPPSSATSHPPYFPLQLRPEDPSTASATLLPTSSTPDKTPVLDVAFHTCLAEGGVTWWPTWLHDGTHTWWHTIVSVQLHVGLKHALH